MEIQSVDQAKDLQSRDAVGSLTEDLRRVLRTELLRDSCSAAGIARLR